MFVTFGNDWNISDGLLAKLEVFICHIFCMRKNAVNEVRFVKYYSKYQNENKIVYISIRPPCQSVLLCMYLEKMLGSKF